jgi:hypothetical protein
MKRLAGLCAVLVCLLFFTGCSVLRIHEEPTTVKTNLTKLKGVPFYIKVGKLKQTTVYTRTWLEVEFTLSDVDAADKKNNPRKAILLLKEDTATAPLLMAGMNAAKATARESGDVTDVVEAFLTAGLKQIEMADIINETKLSPQPVQGYKAITENLISNGTECVTEVDYDHTYYFNGWIPIFGSSTASFELAADGTLSKGSATTDTTALLAQIPMKEYLTKKWIPKEEETATVSSVGPNVPPKGPKAITPPTRVLETTFIQKGYIYTLSRTLPFNSALKQNAVKWGEEDSVIRSVIGADSSKKEDKTNQDTFEGSVSLPKK